MEMAARIRVAAAVQYGSGIAEPFAAWLNN
jgi:hypothetical protein